MGGGGSSGAGTPTTPPGYTGGSVMDYNPPLMTPSPVNNTGSPWTGLGRGISTASQQYAQGVASGVTPPGSPSYLQTPIESASVPFSLIPKGGAPNNEILEALKRLGVMT